MKQSIILSLCCIACILIVGCTVSEKKIVDIEKRIEALSSKGVPDSSLSRAKVFAYQARFAKERGDHSLSRMSADSMVILTAQAENMYQDNMNRLRPWIETQRSMIMQETAQLTGLHKKHRDSVIAVIDSLVNISWFLEAEAVVKSLVNYIPKLKADEALAEELRPKVIGTWTCKQETKHSADKTVHAWEYKIFTFNTDGTVKLVEKKEGKSTPFFKENWEFNSLGKYNLKGDTINLFVERFKAVRQDFEDLKEKDGKKEWVKTSHGTYDSTITDGSQDRFVTYGDLTEDFTHK